MKTTGNYRTGVERFVPSASEAVLLLAFVLFCWPMGFFDGKALYGGNDNDAIAGLSTFAVVAIAWVLGVALRAAMNDMRWWLVIAVAVAIVIPWLALNSFQLGLMTQTAYFVILILGLNIVTGLTGQISLGHGALVGISAYTVAILMDHWGWPLFPAALVAITLTTFVGFGLGIPALRLAGPYLAIATVAAAIIFPLVMKLDKFHDYTGTVQGLKISREERPHPPAFIGDFLESENISRIPATKSFLVDQLNDPDTAPAAKARAREQLDRERQTYAQDVWIYFLTLVPAVILIAAAWNLARSRIGRAFIAVRDAEVAATSMGINVPLYKVVAFGISALYAGVTGALLYMVIAFVAPESFDLVNLSINPLAYLVIGGLASTGGPIIGAIGIKWVPEMTGLIARQYKEFDLLQGALVGVGLIVVMTRMPQGIWGTMVRLNGFSWVQLQAQISGWGRSRPGAFWAALAAGGLVVVIIGLVAGTIWAVFAAGALIVAPQDIWFGAYHAGRRLIPRGMRRDESGKADAT